jgi:acetyl esterase
MTSLSAFADCFCLPDDSQPACRPRQTSFTTQNFIYMSHEQKTTKKAPDYLEDAHLTPAVKEFLKPLNGGGPPLETLSKRDARDVLVNAQKSVKVDLSGMTVAEKTIKEDGYTVKLNIVKPAGVKDGSPAFIFIHGGGWILGDFPTHERLVRDIVVASGYPAVFVNYTPSPEAHYPQSIYEIYAATKWVSANGAQIGVDGKKLAVVGNSVGGNMTAAICLMAKDKGGPELKAQIMLWPVTDSSFTQASYEAYAEQRFLTTPMMMWMWDQYTTDLEARKEIYASPLNASIAQLRDLPPGLIAVDENDILRDEGEAYGRKLAEAGVNVTTVRFNGVIHDWGMLNGLATIPQTRSMVVQVAAELKKYLH